MNTLGGLVDLISNISLGESKERTADLLGHVFEYFLGEFARDEGKKGGEFYTPQEVSELLARISKGRSVVVIEHDMEFVKSIAHKVTVLHQGKLLAAGSMDQVQNNPKVIEVYLGH